MATKKAANEKLIQVALRMTPGEHKRLKAAARKIGVSFSQYVRSMCLAGRA